MVVFFYVRACAGGVFRCLCMCTCMQKNWCVCTCMRKIRVQHVTQQKIADTTRTHQKLVPVCIRGVPICVLGVRQKNSHMGRRITHNEVVRILGLTYTSEGVGRGRLGRVLHKSIKNREINLIVLLLIFLTNNLPAVANGGRNGIHHRRWVPQTYD
jgi:hypothetical protein